MPLLSRQSLTHVYGSLVNGAKDVMVTEADPGLKVTGVASKVAEVELWPFTRVARVTKKSKGRRYDC